MSLLQLPTIITSDTDLDPNTIITTTGQSWIIIGPGFNGTGVTMAPGFASGLYAALGSPALLYAIIFVFSYVGPRDTSANIRVTDPDIITDNSATIAFRDGRISTDKMPVLMLVLTQISPPQWTVYG